MHVCLKLEILSHKRTAQRNPAIMIKRILKPKHQTPPLFYVVRARLDSLPGLDGMESGDVFDHHCATRVYGFRVVHQE